MNTPFNQSSLLTVGKIAPDFALKNQHGEIVTLYKQLETHWVVLFFYPKDHSPICTSQVCAFRNAHYGFQQAGAEVIGISSDSEASHHQFAENQYLPFMLLSDPESKKAQHYGVPKMFGLIPSRVTFVIDPQRTVRMVYSSLFNAKAHMEKALKLLRQKQKVSH